MWRGKVLGCPRSFHDFSVSFLQRSVIQSAVDKQLGNFYRAWHLHSNGLTCGFIWAVKMGVGEIWYRGFYYPVGTRIRINQLLWWNGTKCNAIFFHCSFVFMCLILSSVFAKNVSFWSGLCCNQVRREEENRNKLLGDKKKRDGPDDEMQAVWCLSAWSSDCLPECKFANR